MTIAQNKQLLPPVSERDNLIDQIAKKEIFSILEVLKQHHHQYNIQVMVLKKSDDPVKSKVTLNLIENIEDFEYVNLMYLEYLQTEKKIAAQPSPVSRLTVFKSLLSAVNCLIKAWWCFFKSKSRRQVVGDIDKLDNHKFGDYQNDLSFKKEVHEKIIDFFDLYYPDFFLKDIKKLNIIKKNHDFYDEIRLAWPDRFTLILENKPSPDLIEQYISWSLANQVDQSINKSSNIKFNKI